MHNSLSCYLAIFVAWSLSKEIVASLCKPLMGGKIVWY